LGDAPLNLNVAQKNILNGIETENIYLSIKEGG
jgi:hypothetical protein